jgi:octaheme c-type cytochrome (tetrathionate reductase family)
MLRSFKYIWLLGLLGTALVVVGVVMLALSPLRVTSADPWANVPPRLPHVDHSTLMTEVFATGPEVTAACLSCHENAAAEVAMTTHWTWQSEPVTVSWRDEPVSVGKANTINNFCIGIQSNEADCTRCHAGYGWGAEHAFDFTNTTNVDCLVCHDQSGTYVKGEEGFPAEEVDLLVAAQSVGAPTRANCGSCHFNGGGGNGVKHGDLDSSLYFPSQNLDVHMGGLDFQCTDCHRTEHHAIAGRSISVSVDNANQVFCTDCHETTLHTDARITSHIDTVACQTCHIPTVAQRDPTRVLWDWSAAGDLSRTNVPGQYLQTRGEFMTTLNYKPTYTWYNGTAQRYLLGDTMNPTALTILDPPIGSISDPTALVFPFKIHYARQPYDTVHNILLQPTTAGEGGYWTTFDWDSALESGAEAAGIPYSGNYGFTDTAMYWPLTHMVAPASRALTCADCHSDNGRVDWEALGYYGDPMVWGGRGG